MRLKGHDLFGTKDPVSCIPQTGDDVGVVVELFIYSGHKYVPRRGGLPGRP